MKRPRKPRSRGAGEPQKGSAGSGPPPESTQPLAVTADWIKSVEFSAVEPKHPISFRIDADVLHFFKESGPGYQTRMNAVLRAYMTAHGEE